MQLVGPLPPESLKEANKRRGNMQDTAVLGLGRLKKLGLHVNSAKLRHATAKLEQ